MPERWVHAVSAGAEDKGMRFGYFWLDVAEALHGLAGDQGEYLSMLDCETKGEPLM